MHPTRLRVGRVVTYDWRFVYVCVRDLDSTVELEAAPYLRLQMRVENITYGANRTTWNMVALALKGMLQLHQNEVQQKQPQPTIWRAIAANNQDKMKTKCDLCLAAIVDDNEDALECEGTCQLWFHRYCAGVSRASLRAWPVMMISLSFVSIARKNVTMLPLINELQSKWSLLEPK